MAERDGRWRSLTPFGAVLAEHGSERDAHEHVVTVGLRALADRWTLIDPSTGESQTVCIQQASPIEVVVALGYYSLPGVPTRTIPVDDLATGRVHLRHGG